MMSSSSKAIASCRASAEWRCRFCHGRMSLPTGPVKLASASGAPIVAVFCVRDPDGRVRLIIDQAIEVPSPLSERDLSNVMQQIAAVVGDGIVRAYPEQWLVLNSAFTSSSPFSPSARGGRPGNLEGESDQPRPGLAGPG